MNGKGKLYQPIAYYAGADGTESDATLPWKKTVTIELTGAEQKVGSLVFLIPGSVRDSSGMLKPPKCRILVDGKEVATNDGGKNMCKHTLKCDPAPDAAPATTARCGATGEIVSGSG